MTQKTDTYEDFDARVEKFLRKQMTKAEEQLFKEELANDPNKKARARTMALMASEMKDIRRKQEAAAIQQMAGMSEAEFRKAVGRESSSRPIPMWTIVRRISIAASMIGILTIGGIQYNAYNRTTALGDTYYNLVSSDISSQRGDLDAQSVANLTSLFLMVEKGENLEKAISRLNKLYLRRGASSRQSTSDSDISPFRQTIAWNLALAYLKDGNRNAAKKILCTIIAENAPDKAISQSAAKLLSEIADIPSLW